MTNLQTAISIIIELEHRKGRRGGGYGRTISFIYALFIYLEQPHFINSHYFKTIRHLIITVLKGGWKARAKTRYGAKEGCPLRERKNQNRPYKYSTNHHNQRQARGTLSFNFRL